jgi:hypothetical protein
MSTSPDTNNIIAALGQSNRVRQVGLHVGDQADQELEEVLAVMQVPFPGMTRMKLMSIDGTVVIPDSFLGGSAPRLQYFELLGIPFPGLPKLLLSAANLVSLWLSDIPHSGTFHPKRWSHSSPYCPASEILALGFQPLFLALIGKAEGCLHGNALSSPLSIDFISMALSNI